MPKAAIANTSSPIKRGIKGSFGSILAMPIRFALAHPALKELALKFLCRIPSLESRMHGFVVSRGITSGGRVKICSERSSLTPNGLCIYADLKAAIERHNNGGQ
jgi:hypothetical protein